VTSSDEDRRRQTATAYRFGACELDETTRELRRDGRVVRVGPQLLNILVELIRQRHRVIPRAEIKQLIAATGAVSDAAMHASVSRIREAIGDRDTARPMIQTLSRFGYRFVAPVSVDVQDAAATGRVARHVAVPETSRDFVGRTPTLAALSLALDEARAGRGGCRLFSAEGGAGKTRLLEELQPIATARGFEVLSCGCAADMPNPPAFLPWAQLVRAYARTKTTDTIRTVVAGGAADLARIAPILRDRFRDLPEGPPLDPEQARLRVLASLCELVRRAAAMHPLVIVLDDLDSADASSLQVLHALAREITDQPVLLVGAYGFAGDSAAAVATLSDTLVLHGLCTTVELGAIDADAGRALIIELVGAPPPDELVRAVLTLCAGNPFFLRETLRHLSSCGLLVRGDDRWPDARQIREAGVSEAAHSMVRRSLRLLSSDCLRVLGIAAVIGPEFAFAELERLVSLPAEQTLAAAEEATARNVIVPIDRDGSRYRFRNFFVHATTLELLNPTRRARIRARLA
jgi:predicted ATPase/DNA-binding winged helix-turn-helix (wHTH) protein